MPRNDYLNKTARESEGDETELAASVQIDYILDPLRRRDASLPLGLSQAEQNERGSRTESRSQFHRQNSDVSAKEKQQDSRTVQSRNLSRDRNINMSAGYSAQQGMLTITRLFVPSYCIFPRVMPVETVQCPRNSITVFFECLYEVRSTVCRIPHTFLSERNCRFSVRCSLHKELCRVPSRFPVSTERLPESFP